MSKRTTHRTANMLPLSITLKPSRYFVLAFVLRLYKCSNLRQRLISSYPLAVYQPVQYVP
eukprot:2242547-Prymnesium_polylepis.1